MGAQTPCGRQPSRDVSSGEWRPLSWSGLSARAFFVTHRRGNLIHSDRVLSLKNMAVLSSGFPNHFTYKLWNSSDPKNWLKVSIHNETEIRVVPLERKGQRDVGELAVEDRQITWRRAALCGI